MYKFIATVNFNGAETYINYNGLPCSRLGVLNLFNGRDEAEKALQFYMRYAPEEIPEECFQVSAYSLSENRDLEQEYKAGKKWVVCHSETISPTEDDYDFLDYYMTRDGADRAYKKYKINDSRSLVSICSVGKSGQLIQIKRKKRGN